MYDDTAIPASKVAAGALWGWVLALFIAAWATWAYSDNTVWMMLAFTGCASSALAATLQIRCYSLRVMALLRAARFEGRDAPIHSLR